jgi:hypothetical protein
MQQNRKRHEVVIDIETDENESESENESKNKNGTNYSARMCTVSTIALLILSATQLYATIK